MPSDYAALCDDFYVNARLNLKMDLSMRRDTVLSLFDRLRRERPGMDRLRRYRQELALESRPSAGEGSYDWVAVRKTSVRSGSVHPASQRHAHDLHRTVLESAPFYLDITALDVDHVEVLFGFDLMAAGNHDGIVAAALLGDSPLARLCDGGARAAVEFQPVLGVALPGAGEVQAFFEVKTRSSASAARSGEYREEPISVYVIVRRAGPFGDVKQIPNIYDALAARGEELLDERIVPGLLTPIRDAIVAG